MASGSGLNLWVWLAGGWVESMCVASGCGCKEVCRFPHIVLLILYLLFFLQQHPSFCSFKKMFFLLVYI